MAVSASWFLKDEWIKYSRHHAHHEVKRHDIDGRAWRGAAGTQKASWRRSERTKIIFIGQQTKSDARWHIYITCVRIFVLGNMNINFFLHFTARRNETRVRFRQPADTYLSLHYVDADEISALCARAGGKEAARPQAVKAWREGLYVAKTRQAASSSWSSGVLYM